MEWTETALGWKKLFAEYGRSGMRRKEFCTERGIKLSTFDYWRSRLRKTSGEEPGVVKVGLVSAAAAPITVRVNDRVTVELDGQASEEQLARVLRVAAQL